MVDVGQFDWDAPTAQGLLEVRITMSYFPVGGGHLLRTPFFTVAEPAYDVAAGDLYPPLETRNRRGMFQKLLFPFHAVDRKDPFLSPLSPFGLCRSHISRLTDTLACS